MKDNKRQPQYRLKIEYEDFENNSRTLVEQDFNALYESQFEALLRETASAFLAMGFGKDLIRQHMEVDI